MDKPKELKDKTCVRSPLRPSGITAIGSGKSHLIRFDTFTLILCLFGLGDTAQNVLGAAPKPYNCEDNPVYYPHT